MQLIFLIGANLVRTLSVGGAILLIGLLPIYGYFFFTYRSRLNSSGYSCILLSIVTILSLCLSSIFATSAMVLGMWG